MGFLEILWKNSKPGLRKTGGYPLAFLSLSRACCVPGICPYPSALSVEYVVLISIKCLEILWKNSALGFLKTDGYSGPRRVITRRVPIPAGIGVGPYPLDG